MAALAELLAEIPKGAFRKEDSRVMSLAKPSFTEKCYRPEDFPDLHPDDVVHIAVCGDKLRNPLGGTIYCENNYRCLEYITCPYKGEPSRSFLVTSFYTVLPSPCFVMQIAAPRATTHLSRTHDTTRCTTFRSCTTT